MITPWMIKHPVSWSGRPRRFLFWTWTEYTVVEERYGPNGYETRRRFSTCDEINRNAFD